MKFLTLRFENTNRREYEQKTDARIQTEENTNKKAYLLGLSLVDKFDKSTLVLEGATLQIRTLYHSCVLDTLVSSLLLSRKP